MRIRPWLALPLLVLASLPARAETAASCTGFIASLPAVISTQGVWCLVDNLATPIASGAAITIATHNVTLDCNRHEIAGTADPATTKTAGVLAANRLNVRVRDCTIFQFAEGIRLDGPGGGGHFVADNRIDRSAHGGIFVTGDASTIRGNQVYRTARHTAEIVNYPTGYGIVTRGRIDIVDNVVSLVGGPYAHPAPVNYYGILIRENPAGLVRGNLVDGIDGNYGAAYGVRVDSGDRLVLRDNTFRSVEYAMRCVAAGVVAIGNDFTGEGSAAMVGCTDMGNEAIP